MASFEDPDLRKAADAYVMKINGLFAEEAFPPLYGEHPELKTKLESGKIRLLDIVELHNTKVNFAAELIPSLSKVVNHGGISPLIRAHYSPVLFWAKGICAYHPKRERFFIKLATGISQTASQQSQTPEDTVASEPYLAEAYYRAFLTPKEVQIFFADSARMESILFRAIRSTLALGNKLQIVDVPFFLEMAYVPSDTEAKAMERATLEYVAKHLAKMYPT